MKKVYYPYWSTPIIGYWDWNREDDFDPNCVFIIPQWYSYVVYPTPRI